MCTVSSAITFHFIYFIFSLITNKFQRVNQLLALKYQCVIEKTSKNHYEVVSLNKSVDFFVMKKLFPYFFLAFFFHIISPQIILRIIRAPATEPIIISFFDIVIRTTFYFLLFIQFCIGVILTFAEIEGKSVM